MEDREVQFSKGPFTVQQFGNLKEHQAKSDRKRLQGRTVHSRWEHRRLAAVRTFTLYPDFTLSEVETALSLWKQKKRKEELLAQLHMPPPSGGPDLHVGGTLRALYHTIHIVPTRDEAIMLLIILIMVIHNAEYFV